MISRSLCSDKLNLYYYTGSEVRSTKRSKYNNSRSEASQLAERVDRGIKYSLLDLRRETLGTMAVAFNKGYNSGIVYGAS